MIEELIEVSAKLSEAGITHTLVVASKQAGVVLPPSDHNLEEYIDAHLPHWAQGHDAIQVLCGDWCGRNKNHVERESVIDALARLNTYVKRPEHKRDAQELKWLIKAITEALSEADSFANGDKDSGFYNEFWDVKDFPLYGE